MVAEIDGMKKVTFPGLLACGRRLIGLLLLFLMAAGLLPQAFSDDGVVSPVPIQRVLLAPDKLTAELERAKRGVLVPLSRQEFEDRVQRAAQAGEALKSPPRLVAARYMAKLVDNALEGKAEWKVLNPGTAAGILAVQPFNLALVHAWCDNRD